ncbi:MMPL family domain-containing protein [Ditylenchus destructor]|nr:MMPL family domain-containing protein [Ditylenchus destructor]
MAIDSNVLINERIREELRAGLPPQQAIHAGYERAWATILDSNVTTLIAGLALLAFGSGPIKGFAVVHCLGILTSMFSSVMFSRALVNLWYGRRKRPEVGVHRHRVESPARPARPMPPPTRPRRIEGSGRQKLARELTSHGILPNQTGHPVHEERVDPQRDLLHHLHRGGVLPCDQGIALLDRVHRRHGDPGPVRADRGHQQDPPHRRADGLRRSAGDQLRHLARRADPSAGQARRQAGRAGRQRVRRAVQGRAGSGRVPPGSDAAGRVGQQAGLLGERGRAAQAHQQRSGRPVRRRRAGARRRLGADLRGGRHHGVPGLSLRMEVRRRRRDRQPARRGDHPGLLRLFPVGILAVGAGGRAGGAGLLGERIRGHHGPDPRELPQVPQAQHPRDHRPRDHVHDQPHHHHPRLDPDDGAGHAVLRRPHPALLRHGPDHRHLVRHLLVGVRRRRAGHVDGRQARTRARWCSRVVRTR